MGLHGEGENLTTKKSREDTRYGYCNRYCEEVQEVQG